MNLAIFCKLNIQKLNDYNSNNNNHNASKIVFTFYLIPSCSFHFILFDTNNIQD